ncbi:hypothetical protein [Nodularia sp. UHCC 0506]|nr:hypothetical protein [Nodularia sp. UHCC 0506]MEA5513044.1 hypothetical protein [Nodularia sp. UHCC 0506]
MTSLRWRKILAGRNRETVIGLKNKRCLRLATPTHKFNSGDRLCFSS